MERKNARECCVGEMYGSPADVRQGQRKDERKMKSVLDRIFVEGLGGMTHGLFATLIIGTIIQQIGNYIGGNTGDMIYLVGGVAASLTGAGIGVGVARKLNAQELVVICAAVTGMVGAFASRILAGQVFVDGQVILNGPGEPLGAFVAAYIAIEIGILISGHYPDAPCLYRCGICGRAVCRTADLQLHVMAGIAYQLGHGTAATSYGDHRVCSHGNDPDSSHQFGSAGHHTESVRSCCGGGDCGMLLQYDRVCCCKLPGE